MANVTFQPMSFGVDMQNPAVFNGSGRINSVSPTPWLQPNSPPAKYEPQFPQYSAPVFNQQVPQVAYVPVFVDAQGRPLLQNFLPTVGLNQFMQAPQMNFNQLPCGIPQQKLPKVLPPSPRSNSPTGYHSNHSDSGSSDSGSVSPSPKPQQPRRCPPGLKMDPLDREPWADVSERRFAADNRRRNAEAVKMTRKEPAHNNNRSKKKRFGYRSKQNKIDTVYEALVHKYTEIGTLFDQDDVLRGPSVIRLHVKKYDALCSIEDALVAVESCPGMTIDGVSIPLSMKNTFQKKGFLVYFRLTDVNMVEQAQKILRQFPEFKKCDVANSPTPAKDTESASTAL